MPNTPQNMNQHPEVVRTPVVVKDHSKSVIYLKENKPGQWVLDPKGQPFGFVSESRGMVCASFAISPDAVEYVTVTSAQWNEHAVSRVEGSGAPSAGAAEHPPDGLEGKETK